MDTLFLPVTRPWAVERVVEALNASDIRSHCDNVLLYIDAPDCWVWFDALIDSGWAVTTVTTGRGEPPEGRIERRVRHLAMRLESQKLLRGYDRVLLVEDDTLVPSDVWARLSALLDCGCTAASGLQYSRDGQRIPGVWRVNYEAGVYDPIWPSANNIGSISSCGHYCLMTTGEAYARAPIDPRPNEPIDRAHTKHLAPIGVDFECLCGHLLPDGGVIL